ncbi:Gfo/Idh/MocA family protein [Pseudalkalibacillus caeni]|uniref:Gfo/Idh/MocA family oxidoreductase n=1 Tax=Exobacillus caeni TaxID=2574798 RepID=A0A5R9FC37_9BACL|nr:Gfo/Idh/MocA family oxidoreductase [Pseudalkalibacillus caeni]TLS37215.1 Gfo/Idh/MocA family oxidoreductase [Pseudalkalibacillus caeni]
MSLTVAVIGAGIIAVEHLDALKGMEELQAIAVADIDEAKAEKISEDYQVKGYSDYRKMIESESPDIVVITLPHFLHKEAAVFAASKGCHILLEKPMALTITECDEIIGAAEKNRICLMVGHIQHYFQENIIAREQIESGELGELIMINETRHMNYFTSGRPQWFLEAEKSGGGIVMNIGAHCIDKTQWLMGSRYAKVLSKLTYRGEVEGFSPDVEGSGLLYLETIDQIPVTISLSGYEGVPKHVTELIFTNGMMKVEVGKGVWISEGDAYQLVHYPKGSSPFKKQFAELTAAINRKEVIRNSGEYARSIIEVIEACYRSNKEGKIIELKDASLQRRSDPLF